MRWFHRVSRVLHQVLGLFLIPYGVLMGLTGILVNHPEWIAGVDLPRALVPAQYVARDFERETLRRMVFSRRDPHRAFLAGSEGVWETRDDGRTFTPLDAGFPRSAHRRDTHALLLLEDGDVARLLAGTDDGLYALEIDAQPPVWRRIPLGASDTPLRSLLRIDDAILAATTSGIHRAPTDGLAFEELPLERRVPADAGARSTNLVTFLFDLHSGAFFGLPGKLVYDLVGLIVAFLSLSAFYLWYHPRRARARRAQRVRRALGRTRARALFRWLLRTHLRIGIWIAPIVLAMAATGLFLRPPLIAWPAGASLDSSWHPALPALERFDGRILRVHHDAIRGRLLVETRDGFWEADERCTEPFAETSFPLPVHVMGTTVIATDGDGALVAGSFSGGYRLDPASGAVHDLVTGEPAGEVSRFRLAPHMVVGYFETPAGERFVTTFQEGIVPLGDARRGERFAMPEALRSRQTLSLWKFAFELHNGRYFRDWMGFFAFLVPILGSLLFLVLTLTGILDWIVPRWRHSPQRRSSSGVK